MMASTCPAASAVTESASVENAPASWVGWIVSTMKS